MSKKKNDEEKEVKIEEIKEAANGIKEGKLVLFPTKPMPRIRRQRQKKKKIRLKKSLRTQRTSF